VRKKAVRELYELDPDQAATLVNERSARRRPTNAVASVTALPIPACLRSIDDLKAENHESCYGAFSLLFLVAKAGVVEPLISVIENNSSCDLSLA
jgi:hypothetical protein